MPPTDRELRITAIVVSHLRTDWLIRALESLRVAAERTGTVQLQVHLAINGVDERSDRAARELFASAHWKAVPTRHISLSQALVPAAARNRLLDGLFAGSPGVPAEEWLFFLDDDAYLPENYFDCFRAAWDRYPAASVIGGPNLTPPESARFQAAVGSVLSSVFGAYTSHARYRPIGHTRLSDEQSLILCNLLIRRDALQDLRFPEDFLCNEENWLLQDLARRRREIIHAPALIVWHERRGDLRRFVRQVLNYGVGRGKNMRRRPTTCRAPHLLPGVCVLVGLLAGMVAVRSGHIPGSFVVLAALYGALTLVSSARSADPIWAVILYPALHVAYGVGVIRGIVFNR